jgi:MOSC domain-containing protein YiiM
MPERYTVELAGGRSGFYLKVVQEGEVEAGAVQVKALPESWRDHFQQLIAQLQRQPAMPKRRSSARVSSMGSPTTFV